MALHPERQPKGTVGRGEVLPPRIFRVLVDLEGESSNALFDTLHDWNVHLKSLERGPQGPAP
jgi:hypothetical protein